MKVQELFENAAQKGTAEKKLEDLMLDLASYIEDRVADHELEFGQPVKKGDSIFLHNESDIEHLAIGAGFQIVKYIVQDKLSPNVECSLILDVPYTPKGLTAPLKSIISKFFKEQNIHLTWPDMSPWQFKDHARSSAKFTLMKFDPEPMKEPVRSSSGPRYDPRAEFNSRPGEMARQARVRGSAYSDSFGGDSSNYRK